jgi:hypothetical protein
MFISVCIEKNISNQIKKIKAKNNADKISII